MNHTSAAVPQQAQRAFPLPKIDPENLPKNPRFGANCCPDFSASIAERNFVSSQRVDADLDTLTTPIEAIFLYTSTTPRHTSSTASGPEPTPEITRDTDEAKRPTARRKPRKPKPRKRTRDDQRRRRDLKSIPGTDYRELIEAEPHARRLGAPIDTLVTIRPKHLDALEPEDRQAFWIKTYKSLEQWHRDRGIPFVLLWSREATDRMTGRGEHFHLALHIGTYREALRKRLARTFHGTELDIRDASDVVRRLDCGTPGTVATYVGKACHQEVWGKNPNKPHNAPHIPHRPSGPVYGKRSGVSAVLSTKAIEAWRTEGRSKYGAALERA